MEKGITLSVCIPNYNRPDRLEKLVRAVVNQILNLRLERIIEICISDDCSPLNPDFIIEKLKTDYPAVLLNYRRNEQNMGMDHNFLNSVMMAQGKYAWIIGNDDLPTENAFHIFMNVVNDDTYKDVDFIVTPFDCYDYENNYRMTTYPFGSSMGSFMIDTNDRNGLHQLIMNVQSNGAMFDFLSNVIFKRERWLEHANKFDDKMNTLFIQIYMNMQTLLDGARYLYIPEKIIYDFIDDDTNETLDRTYKIVVGLYDVYSFFYSGEERRHLERKVLDIFIQSFLFEMEEHDKKRARLCGYNEGKINALKKYYIKKKDRNEYFNRKLIAIYGAGNNGLLALEELGEYVTDIVGFCDADKNKQGKIIHGKEVFDYNRLKKLYAEHKDMIVVVANHLFTDIIVQQLEMDMISNIAIIT